MTGRDIIYCLDSNQMFRSAITFITVALLDSV